MHNIKISNANSNNINIIIYSSFLKSMIRVFLVKEINTHCYPIHYLLVSATS